jgi:hypothetical protein
MLLPWPDRAGSDQRSAELQGVEQTLRQHREASPVGSGLMIDTPPSMRSSTSMPGTAWRTFAPLPLRELSTTTIL